MAAGGDRLPAGLAVFCLALALGSPAGAQVTRPGDIPLPVPEFEGPAPPPLPAPAPPPPVAPAVPGAPRIAVREFRFVGNTVFTAEQLNEVASAYLRTPADLQAALERFFTACGVDLEADEAVDPHELAKDAANSQTLAINQLLELRQLLTLLYVECGYINSGALLDETITQAVLDRRVIVGTVTYQIIEGRLDYDEINVYGTGRLRENYVRDRLERATGPPLNIDKLEERFRILLQDPQIERMNAELRPGPERGESILDVEVTPAPPVDLFLIVDNHRPPSIGSVEGGFEMTMRNVTGFGDTLGLAFGGGEGGPKLDVGYALPLTPQDLTLGIGYEYDSATVVEEPLDELDIESESWTVAFGLSQPIYRTASTELSVGARFERRHSQTKLLNRPFSFSPGVDNGESDVSVVRSVVEWTNRSSDQVIAARSTLSNGIDQLNATDNAADLPDGQYLAWLGQAQLARRWRLADAVGAPDGGAASWLRDACAKEWLAWYCGQNMEVILRASTQLADDPLLPIEQFAVGGANTVRGYRENQLVRDNGVVASIEFRLPLYPLALPFASSETALLRLAPFFDYGAAWNHDESTDDIASVGVGLVWDPTPWLSAQVYYGYKLDNVVEPEDNNDLQDHGISFRFAIRASYFLPQGS